MLAPPINISALVSSFYSGALLPFSTPPPFKYTCIHTLQLTSLCDAEVPADLLHGYLQDSVRLSAVEGALQRAVHDITTQRGLQCRVLVLGSTMGVLPLLALRAGAEHVTVVDRWAPFQGVVLMLVCLFVPLTPAAQLTEPTGPVIPKRCSHPNQNAGGCTLRWLARRYCSTMACPRSAGT
jgi:hypothetical protein